MAKTLFSWIIPGLNKRQPRLEVEKFIITHIKCRDLISGDALLPYREFAAINAISEGTIRRAYSNLIVQGWLSAKPGGGTFVAQRIPGEKVPYRTSGFTDKFPAGLEPYFGSLSMATTYTRSLRIIVASLQFITALQALPPQSIEQREVITEKAIADMILNGDLTAYQKTLRLNAKRDRYNLNWVLNNYLSDHLSFEMPEHGLMFWLKFRDDIGLNDLLDQLEKMGIKVPFHPNNQKTDSRVNHMLLGFGHYQVEEAEGAAKLLKQIIDQSLQQLNN